MDHGTTPTMTAPSTSHSDQGAISFTENHQAQHLLQKLHHQQQNGDFCDVIFLVGGHELRAHRCVMAANSPAFDVEFCNEQAPAKLVLTNHSPVIFMAVLEYLYTGTIVISRTNVTDLLKLANQYVIEKLKTHCCEFLERTMTVSNCYATKAIAELCHLPQLTKNIEAFTLTNLSAVIEQEEILNLDDHRFETFLANKSMPLTEDMKFGLLIKWIQQDFDDRHQKLPVLLQHIQWSQINQLNIVAGIRDSVMFRDSEWCTYIILQLLEDNHMISPVHLSTLEHLKQMYGSFIPMPTFSSEPQLGTESQSTSQSSDTHGNTDSYQGNAMPPDSLYQNSQSQESDNDDADSIPVPQEESEENSEVPSNSYNGEIVDIADLSSIVSIQPVKNSNTQIVEPIRFKISRSKITTKKTLKRLKSKPASALEKVDLPIRKYKCSHCNFTSKELKKMERHEQSAHRPDKHQNFTCSMCQYHTTYNRDYYKHMKGHFPGPPFQCDENWCDWSGERIQQLLNHRMVHRDERPHACAICSMKFRTKNNLDAHVRNHKGRLYDICFMQLSSLSCFCIMCL